MYISRVIIRNFRNFKKLDIPMQSGVSCIIGENNIGKTNLLFAIRLAIDANLPSYARQLTENDFHAGIDISKPKQIIVSLEIRDYKAKTNEEALAGSWAIDDDIAYIHYRFRPKYSVREELEEDKKGGRALTLEDYGWEWTGGGPGDPLKVKWDEQLGDPIRISDLQSFHVVFLQALRDVTQDLRQVRVSPLGRLVATSEIPEAEKRAILDTLKDANDKIATNPKIKKTGEDIEKAFTGTAGASYPIKIRVGVSDPSFASISRSLTLLLSDSALTDFDTVRNGLGLNNILYISMLLEYFERRIADKKTAGQLLIVEEPEAHLHPQLQRTLYSALSGKPFQTILSTHSTHITSLAPLKTHVILTNSGSPAITASVPYAGKEQPEVKDLERYLDATRSVLLYARKVILVEGPAELFIIPPLVKKVMGLDLDSLGISVIPIYGVHFDVYAKLFGEGAIEKKCAIIADGDLQPSDATAEDEIDLDTILNLKALENKFVKTFQCKTTFERALTSSGMLIPIAETAERLNRKEFAKELRAIHSKIGDGKDHKDQINELRGKVLNLARKVGKARFAQLLSEQLYTAETIPSYIKNAIEWLTAE